MSGNPFPGPQPYRTEDRHRFFGREEMTQKLVTSLLAHPCVTLFGPSGAGKSSLMQAGVMPLLAETHDFRIVHIEGWLKNEAPLERLAQTLYEKLQLVGPPTSPHSIRDLETVLELAELRSDRPILIYLDQFEQLLHPERDAAQLNSFLKGLQSLVRRPRRGLQLVLALREDHLGLLRDRARGRRELWDQGFRLRPLSVGEMAQIACQQAAQGVPAQAWPEAEVRELMHQVRVPGQDATDEAEVQAVFAQIVCRALWSAGGIMGSPDAEPLVYHHLEMTLEGLGPHREHARQLLEEHLITSDGSRTLLMEQQVRAVLSELSEQDARLVLSRLEAEAILHAQQHHGSLYFELGHDWLAKKVFDFRQERLRKEAEAQRLQHERAARRRLAIIAGVAVGVSLVLGLVAIWALLRETRAHTHALMAGARSLLSQDRPELAAKLLLELSAPENTLGWQQTALDVLASNTPEMTLHCHAAAHAAFSPDGQRMVMVCADGTLEVWQTDGKGPPLVTQNHGGKFSPIAFSPDGHHVVVATEKHQLQMWWSAQGEKKPIVFPGHTAHIRSIAFSASGQHFVTASEDGTARVWTISSTTELIRLSGHTGIVTSAAFSPDSRRVVTTSEDFTTRIWNVDGSGEPVVLHGPKSESRIAAFSPDGRRVVSGYADGTAQVWNADGSDLPVVLRGHENSVLAAIFSWDGQHVVTASADGTARVWNTDGSGQPVLLRGHTAGVTSVTWGPDKQHLITASEDHTARVWSLDGTGQPLVLKGHEAPVISAAFSLDGQHVLTSSWDGTVRRWSTRGSAQPVVLRGHQERVPFATFSPNGTRVVTASWDSTARIWNADGSGRPMILRGHSGPVLYAAFSPDGQRVVTTSVDGTMRLWSAYEPKPPVVLQGHEAPMNRAALSPDGRHVVTTSPEGPARVWDVNSSGPPVVIATSKPILQAAFSPDGLRVITLLEDFTAWELKADGTGAPEPLAQDALPAGLLPSTSHGLAVHPRIGDATAILEPIDGHGDSLVLRGHEAPVTSAVFSPDGRHVVTASEDHTARVWPLFVPELQQLLRELNSDCLPPEIRRAYLDESSEQSQEHYEECERTYGRPPFFRRP
ncbi:nSTAND1 domain-containing NTPase [Hyalangium versicolor]|uniref:nSTAND1 domain-containing NTPase n=1 Tax=Hyalangium versicolor TaxID=2861190 RepID=UPI001CCEB2E5|nr:hypothetical protein [Hyalangium versicolor]